MYGSSKYLETILWKECDNLYIWPDSVYAYGFKKDNIATYCRVLI